MEHRGKDSMEGSPRKHIIVSLVIAVLVSIAIALVAWQLYGSWQAKITAQAKSRVHARLMDIQENLYLSLGKIEMFANTFGRRVEEGLSINSDLRLADVATYLDYLGEASPSFLFGSLSRNFHTVDQYPAKGGEAMGVDLTLLPDFVDHVLAPSREKRVIIDAPLHFTEDVHRLVVRFPLTVNDDFWGLLSLHFDFAQFVKDVGVDSFSSAYRYAFSFHHPGGSEQFHLGEVMQPQIETIVVESSFSSLSWQMQAQPLHSWTSFLYLEQLYMVFGSLFSLSMGLLIYIALRRYQVMKRRSITDSLTGLYSRHGFDRHMEREIGARRHFFLALLDVDNFKRINDTYGHTQGDKALITLGDSIRGVIRPWYVASRYGGDEFAFLLKDCTDGHCVQELFDTLSTVIFVVGDEHLPIRMSMGAVSTMACGFDEGALKEAIDRTLHWAKTHGKGQLCIADEESGLCSRG